MRTGRRVRLIGAACAVIGVSLVGCSKAPMCEVSPVELEELREDISVLQADLKRERERAAQLSADLAAKKADLAEKRSKPAELRAQLEQVKRGAGKTEKEKADEKKAAGKGTS